MADTELVTLPTLAAEDYTCERCKLSYSQTDVARCLDYIATVPNLAATAGTAVRHDGWSIPEYLCHLRDVYTTYTIRLYRARTEDRPVLEPMFNDLRAHRFAYAAADPTAMKIELKAAVQGFLDEAAEVTDWSRMVTRLPGEERTTRWLVRQAMHEGVHHLDDIRRLQSCE